MVLSYAVILERVTIALREAERLCIDDPTPEHAALVKGLRDPVEHLGRLVDSARARRPVRLAR